MSTPARYREGFGISSPADVPADDLEDLDPEPADLIDDLDDDSPGPYEPPPSHVHVLTAVPGDFYDCYCGYRVAARDLATGALEPGTYVVDRGEPGPVDHERVAALRSFIVGVDPADMESVVLGRRITPPDLNRIVNGPGHANRKFGDPSLSIRDDVEFTRQYMSNPTLPRAAAAAAATATATGLISRIEVRVAVTVDGQEHALRCVFGGRGGESLPIEPDGDLADAWADVHRSLAIIERNLEKGVAAARVRAARRAAVIPMRPTIDPQDPQ